MKPNTLVIVMSDVSTRGYNFITSTIFTLTVVMDFRTTRKIILLSFALVKILLTSAVL